MKIDFIFYYADVIHKFSGISNVKNKLILEIDREKYVLRLKITKQSI